MESKESPFEEGLGNVKYVTGSGGFNCNCSPPARGSSVKNLPGRQI
jgi:hypothetical protein